MSAEKRDFDLEAALWDEKPTRVKLAHDIATAIIQQITLNTQMDVLDFGCGTGLLTLQLQPFVRSITGVDSSAGMLDVLTQKSIKHHLHNVKTLQLDLEQGDALPGNYHLVVSNMTLHHIENVKPLLGLLHKAIAPAGYLGIADLDCDDGQFHENHTGVFHNGFERAAICETLTEVGFQDVRIITAAEVLKPTASGETRHFTIFLLTGQKST